MLKDSIVLLKNNPIVFIVSVIIIVFCASVVLKTARIAYHNVLYSYSIITPIFASNITAKKYHEQYVVPDDIQHYMKDLSVVSAGLILFTFLLIGYGALLLLFCSADKRKSINKRFPFPSSYQFYYVQIGLIGTIFGFITAFSGIDIDVQSTEIGGQADVLFQALSTALWSTFTAIVLAYMVCPMVVEPVFKFLTNHHCGFGVIYVNSAIDELKERTVSASESLEQLAIAVNGLGKQVNSERLNVIEDNIKSIQSSLNDDIKKQDNRLSSLENWKREMEAKLTAIHDLAKETDDITKRLEPKVTRIINTFSDLKDS